MKPVPAPQSSRIIRAGGALVWRRVRKTVTPADLMDGKIKISGGKTPVAPTTYAGEAFDDLEVLLVHRPRYHDWSWPKGKLEVGENTVAAAVREVEEETGVPVVLHAPLLTQRYRLGTGTTKEVYYWVGTVADSASVLKTRPPVERAPSEEIDRAIWVPVSKARKMLTRRGDRRLLDDLLLRAEARIMETAALVLTATANTEDVSAGAEVLSLSRLGVAQSLDMIGLFSAFGVQSLIPDITHAARQTLRPYAAVANLELVSTPAHPLEVVAQLQPGIATVIGVNDGLLEEYSRVLQNQLVRGAGLHPADLPTRLGDAEILVFHIAPSDGSTKATLVSWEKHSI